MLAEVSSTKAMARPGDPACGWAREWGEIGGGLELMAVHRNHGSERGTLKKETNHRDSLLFKYLMVRELGIPASTDAGFRRGEAGHPEGWTPNRGNQRPIKPNQSQKMSFKFQEFSFQPEKNEAHHRAKRTEIIQQQTRETKGSKRMMGQFHEFSSQSANAGPDTLKGGHRIRGQSQSGLVRLDNEFQDSGRQLAAKRRCGSNVLPGRAQRGIKNIPKRNENIRVSGCVFGYFWCNPLVFWIFLIKFFPGENDMRDGQDTEIRTTKAKWQGQPNGGTPD